MRHFWHTRKGEDALILFCSGWGMDHHPLGFLKACRYDVCLLHDYRDMTLPAAVEDCLSGYKRRFLVCWSMGVWAGQQLFSGKQELFSRRIAINGTLLPIDDEFGIPVAIYDTTCAAFDEDGRDRFYRRMCREKGVLQKFLRVVPGRKIIDQKEELERLREMATETGGQESIYTDVMVSENDLVMPTANQRAFWRKQAQILSLRGCHFPFFRWQSWEDLIDLVQG